MTSLQSSTFYNHQSHNNDQQQQQQQQQQQHSQQPQNSQQQQDYHKLNKVPSVHNQPQYQQHHPLHQQQQQQQQQQPQLEHVPSNHTVNATSTTQDGSNSDMLNNSVTPMEDNNNLHTTAEAEDVGSSAAASVEATSTEQPFTHKHAMRRPRGQGGRFLTASEIAELEKKKKQEELEQQQGQQQQEQQQEQQQNNNW
ncbi:CCAAT-binding transcription factor (CBF-B/NF-YA) subunit B family protein [Candida parapsilosis]|uniref:CCAAT-binding transcription factor (CBF-B/NF-YA) subunit B family protein n=1 Tax=Candida parapsilosis TaxID=5480 RepID=A0A8X7NNW5_CANPA|nr:CCAAT-binding transcription factor (CBF-B/NF-YA) subunit B family protein [Candida parapsilosis]